MRRNIIETPVEIKCIIVYQDAKDGKTLEGPVGPGDSPQVREKEFGGGGGVSGGHCR